MKPRMLVVVPTYGALDYAARAADSALDAARLSTPHVLLVDDASPELQDVKTWDRHPHLGPLLARHARAKQSRLTVLGFQERGGLTRAWNHGLWVAKTFGFEYACCTNSDVVFARGWDVPILPALGEYALLGPTTNAPGDSPAQDVRNFAPGGYTLSEDRAKVDALGTDLAKCHGGKVVPMALNGFCLVARTATWWDHAYDPFRDLVFCPQNHFNSRGQPNPTPLMTLNEDELQARWRAQGLKIGCCPGSYVLHYRAATRGERHRRGESLRLGDPDRFVAASA